MDEYLRVRQASFGATTALWSYDGNNMLSQVTAIGIQQYNYSFDVNTVNLTLCYTTNKYGNILTKGDN